MISGTIYTLSVGSGTFVFEGVVDLFVGALPLSLEFVVAVVDGSLVAYKGLCLVESLHKLPVFADEFVTLDKSQLVVLELSGSNDVGDVMRIPDLRRLIDCLSPYWCYFSVFGEDFRCHFPFAG